MPNFKPDQGRFVADHDTPVLPNPPAQNNTERRTVLQYLLDNDWASANVGCFERIDDPHSTDPTKSEHGWVAYPWKKDPKPRSEQPLIG